MFVPSSSVLHDPWKWPFEDNVVWLNSSKELALFLPILSLPHLERRWGDCFDFTEIRQSKNVTRRRHRVREGRTTHPACERALRVTSLEFWGNICLVRSARQRLGRPESKGRNPRPRHGVFGPLLGSWQRGQQNENISSFQNVCETAVFVLKLSAVHKKTFWRLQMPCLCFEFLLTPMDINLDYTQSHHASPLPSLTNRNFQFGSYEKGTGKRRGLVKFTNGRFSIIIRRAHFKYFVVRW